MPVILHAVVPGELFQGGATYQTLVGDSQGSTPIRIGIQISPPGYRTSLHSHPYLQAITILEGQGEAWMEECDGLIRTDAGNHRSSFLQMYGTGFALWVTNRSRSTGCMRRRTVLSTSIRKTTTARARYLTILTVLAALPMSVNGTFLPCQPRRAMSAIGARPADICSLRGFRIPLRSSRPLEKQPVMGGACAKAYGWSPKKH